MNAIQKAINWLSGRQKALPSGYMPIRIINGQIVWDYDNDERLVREGYLNNDIVYSIINLITNKAKLAPMNVYKIVDEGALKLYHSSLTEKRYKEAREYRQKALEAYDGDRRLNDLLKYPNNDQTYADYIEESCGFKLLTGDRFVWASLLDAGSDNGKPFELRALPSQYMQIIAEINKFPVTVTGYQLNYGYVQQFTQKEIMHEKYWNPRWDVSGVQLYGLSPLRAACRNIERNNSAKNTSIFKYKNGGAEGIIYLDDPEIDSELSEQQIGAIKKAWDSEYQGTDNAGKTVISGYKVGYQKIGDTPVDLGIIESEKWDLRMLCNIYGVPSELLNDPDNKSYNNKEQAERALTSRCALPLRISDRDSLNRKLRTDWGYKGTNIYVDFDLSVYPELQEDMKDKADWLSRSVMTVRQRYEALGWEMPDNIPDEIADMLLVPNNLKDIESMGIDVQDIAPEVADLNKSGLL